MKKHDLALNQKQFNGKCLKIEWQLLNNSPFP